MHGSIAREINRLGREKVYSINEAVPEYGVTEFVVSMLT